MNESSTNRCANVSAFIAATLAIAFVGVNSALGADRWKAGTGRVVITPEQPMWMSGYAARTKPAEGKLHDLWAKALALQDRQGQRAVIITLDLCGIDRQFAAEVCTELEKKHQLKRSQIVLCVSHTHSGPVVERNLAPMFFLDSERQKQVHDYTVRLRGQVVEIADQALQKLEPAVLQWGQGTATFAVNRRNNKEADVPTLREQGKLQGPVDHDVPVLAVKNSAGELTAILFGYACHATTLDDYQWSADYPGHAQIELEKRHSKATAMFVAGCGADQNPIPRRRVELAENYGQQLAAAVDEVIDGPLAGIEPDLFTVYREIDLPFANVPSREDLEKDRQSADKYVASRAKHLLEQIGSGRPLGKTYPYPVQTWQLGRVVRMIWLGGEVVVDYSLRLKGELGDRNWISAYSNDVMAYIPSRRVLGEGGYEGGGAMVYYGLQSPWSEEVEQLIVGEAKRQSMSRN
jgi:Neutral/alkaline non-lysosomal ceramidase, N-terminal